MNQYEHTQIGKWMIAIFLLPFTVIVLITYPIMKEEALTSADRSEYVMVMGVIMLILLFLTALYYQLRIIIDDTHLRIRFGIGLIRRSFALEDITKAKAVRNQWYYGWGTRLTPHGWLYNVSGLDAVQIEVDNGRRKRSYRIGSDEHMKLLYAIQEAANLDTDQ